MSNGRVCNESHGQTVHFLILFDLSGSGATVVSTVGLQV